MTKLNNIFSVIGVLLLLGGVLLLVFPNIMKYVFAAVSVLAGIVLLCTAWNGRKAGR